LITNGVKSVVGKWEYQRKSQERSDDLDEEPYTVGSSGGWVGTEMLPRGVGFYSDGIQKGGTVRDELLE
jgi:hypothetical protein